MKNDLIPFEFENLQLRTVLIKDEAWFMAKDVCDLLTLTNSRQSVDRLDEDEKLMYTLYTSGQNRDVTVINESGLYSLILTSNKPEAKKFKKWVTSEVIPSIRKHGAYLTPKTLSEALDNPEFITDLLLKLKDEKDRRIKAEQEKAILIHTNKTCTVTEIAKECGFKSAMELNKLLSQAGIQFNQNGTWVLYSKYSSMGYDQIKQEVLDNGKIIYHRRFTGIGRDFILNLFK